MRPPAIKFLRRLLISIMVVVGLSVLVNALYFRMKQSQTVKITPKMISAELKRSVESLEIIERRGSHIRFKIRARHSRETRTNTSILEGIEAFDFNPDGSVRYSIQSDFASYDQARKMAQFSGNVRMFPEKNLELRMKSLQYDLNTNIGSATEGIQWISSSAEGTAQDARFYRDKEVLELKKKVQFVIKQQEIPFSAGNALGTIRAKAGNVICSFEKNTMDFSGNVTIESERSGTLAGDGAALAWSSDRRKIQSLEIIGNAHGILQEEKESKILDGDRLSFLTGPTGFLDAIHISGQASLEQKNPLQEQNLRATNIRIRLDPVQHSIAAIRGESSVKFQSWRGGEEQIVTGDYVEAQFDPEEKHLKKIEARGRLARFASSGNKDAAENDLSASVILVFFRVWNTQTAIDRIQADGSVHWAFASQKASLGQVRTLDAYHVEVQYSHQGNFPDSGEAAGKVIFTEKQQAAYWRQVNADVMNFSFYPEKNFIKEAAADGHVYLLYRSEKPQLLRESWSDHITADFAVKDGRGYLKNAVQHGNFQYRDGAFNASAGRCTYDADTQSLQLLESPAIVEERGSTTGRWMKYDLKEKMLRIKGKVKTALSGQKNNLFFQSSEKASSAVILAEEMRLWTDSRRIKYEMGKVFSEEQQLRADVIEIIDKGAQVIAQGSVHHTVLLKEGAVKTKLPGQNGSDAHARVYDIKSDYLKYISKDNTVNYRKNVNISSSNWSLSIDDLYGFYDPATKKIKQAKGIGNVVLRSPKYVGRGESAFWQPDNDFFEVTGNPVEVEDRERGHAHAHRLTYFQAGDRIVLGN